MVLHVDVKKKTQSGSKLMWVLKILSVLLGKVFSKFWVFSMFDCHRVMINYGPWQGNTADLNGSMLCPPEPIVHQEVENDGKFSWKSPLEHSEVKPVQDHPGLVPVDSSTSLCWIALGPPRYHPARVSWLGTLHKCRINGSNMWLCQWSSNLT